MDLCAVGQPLLPRPGVVCCPAHPASLQGVRPSCLNAWHPQRHTVGRLHSTCSRCTSRRPGHAPRTTHHAPRTTHHASGRKVGYHSGGCSARALAVRRCLRWARHFGRCLRRCPCHRHDGARWGVLEVVVAPHLAPAPRAAQAMAQSQHVACDGGPGGRVGMGFALHVVHHGFLHFIACARKGRRAMKLLVPL